jgi:DNA-binding CsgD family transcriptional regulator
MKQATIARSANKITSYIENYIALAGAESRDEVFELFDKMQWLFPQWVISTCPMIHRDFAYISNNCFDLFGYTEEYLVNNSRLEKYFNHVHEADRKELLDCISHMHDYLETIPPSEHHHYRQVFHYRFQKGNKQFIYLHDEKASLDLQSGKLYYGLFRDISAERFFTGVKVELFRQQHTMTKVKEYKPSERYQRLSKREGQLVALIRQGLRTKEIAAHLNISPNTARNIKSKLFEKFGVSSSIELLNATT